MILLDAVYINKSGGKVLLDYLIREIEAKKLPCFYLLDARIAGLYSEIPQERKLFLKSGLTNRYKFYKQNKDAYTHILCFGNIPPMVRCTAVVYTYFHQRLFLEVPKNFSRKGRFVISLKVMILSLLKRNSNFFIVQSVKVKDALAKKFDIALDKILVLPFYPELPKLKQEVEKEKNSFLYVSSGAVHKNHKLLFSAFQDFYSQNKTGKLSVTLSNSDLELINLVEQYNNQGIPIVNIGYVPQQELAQHYAKSEFFIHPSLSESFGLGLIEATQFNCKVIGADLAYTYQVCEPSLAFNPTLKDAMVNAFSVAVNSDLKDTKPLISNKVEAILELLS